MLNRIGVQSRIIFGIAAFLAIICVVFGLYRTVQQEYGKAFVLLITFFPSVSVIGLIYFGRLQTGRILFICLMYVLLLTINLKFHIDQILWQYPGIVAMTFALRGYKEVFTICLSLVVLNTIALSDYAEANLLVTYAGSQMSLIFLCAVVVELLMSNIQSAQTDAETDSLTGLKNRKAFDMLFTQVFENSKQKGSASLLLIDIDFFKSINDKYGHMFGDVVLRTIATSIQASIRHSDYAFRYGGEEFAVLLPRTNILVARVIAERIRMEIEKTTVSNENNDFISCTASIGLAVSSEKSARDWLSVCDALLYQAKRNGRNCIRYEEGRVYS